MMRFPSRAQLKEQANRLVAYMGNAHRFRLKPASSLEALAAMYGQPDWNTLHALADEDRAPASNRADLTQLAHQNTFPLTWPRLGTWSRLGPPDLSVSSDDWFRHTLALGGSKQDRRAWLLFQFLEQRDRHSPGVFLNVFGADMLDAERSILRRDGVLVDLRQGEGLALNLMADMEPACIASTLLWLHKPLKSAGEDYYMQQANYTLAVVLQAMRAAKMRISLNSLRALFPSLLPRAASSGLHQLAAALPEDSGARESLMLFLSQFGFDSDVVPSRSWVANYTLVTQTLDRLAATPWAQMLFSDNPSARGLFALMSEGQCLAIEGPDESDGRAEQAVVRALRAALSRRLSLPRDDKDKSWVFGFAEVDTFGMPQGLPSLTVMVEQARSARTAVLMTARDTRALHSTQTGERLLSHVRNQLHLTGCSHEKLQEFVELMARQPVLVQPDRITVSLGL